MLVIVVERLLSSSDALYDDLLYLRTNRTLVVHLEFVIQDLFEGAVVEDRVSWTLEELFVVGVVGEVAFQVVDVTDRILLGTETDVAVGKHIHL